MIGSAPALSAAWPQGLLKARGSRRRVRKEGERADPEKGLEVPS